MTTTTEYQVSGMSCAHCETAVTEEVRAVPGVQGIEVSAETGRLLVVGSTELDDALVIAAVDEAGYRAVRSS
jgi:copper chaperone CopZ